MCERNAVVIANTALGHEPKMRELFVYFGGCALRHLKRGAFERFFSTMSTQTQSVDLFFVLGTIFLKSELYFSFNFFKIDISKIKLMVLTPTPDHKSLRRKP